MKLHEAEKLSIVENFPQIQIYYLEVKRYENYINSEKK